MNKSGFIKQLSEKLNIDESRAREIADLLEDNFLIGKKNKEKTINLFIEKLNVSEEEADNIFNTSCDIIKENLLDKIKHPFKDLDEED